MYQIARSILVYDAAWVALRATDALNTRLALARNYTTRSRRGTVFLLSRGTGRVVSTTSSAEDELAMEEKQLALSRPAFFGPLGQEILERISDRGVRVPLPPPPWEDAKKVRITYGHISDVSSPVCIWQVQHRQRGVSDRDTQPSTAENASYAMHIN